MIIYYFLGFFAALFQTFVGIVNLPALIVVLAGSRKEEKESYQLALILGLLTDFLSSHTLGYFATIYLLLSFLIRLIKTSFRWRFVWLAIFLVGSQLILQFLEMRVRF